MKFKTDGNLEVYFDGPSLEEIKRYWDSADGFTFNPTLFKSMGVVNYLNHCRQLCEIANGKPLSLEVTADDHSGMIRQAKQLSDLTANVWVKVPITFCDGSTTKYVVEELHNAGINVNVTAVFSLEQVKELSPHVDSHKTIISIFAGRIYDLGLDAFSITNEIVKWNNSNLGAKILWASPRMVYDIIKANQCGCNIITVPPSMFSKTSLWGKSLNEYSLETVNMFFSDAKLSGYEF